jgi:hypothetical protein
MWFSLVRKEKATPDNPDAAMMQNLGRVAVRVDCLMGMVRE